MNKVNLSVFIVPNAGCAGFALFNWKNELAKMEALGITASAEEPLYQVWLHCPEKGLDNVTDHGWGGLEDLLETETTSAPGFLPAKLLLAVKEGEIRAFTAQNGCEVSLRFEQLPYRYARFGRFEEVAEYLIDKTEENIKFQRDILKKGA